MQRIVWLRSSQFPNILKVEDLKAGGKLSHIDAYLVLHCSLIVVLFMQAYDCVLARAVAEMRILAELSLPLVKIGGSLVAAKGPNPQVATSGFVETTTHYLLSKVLSKWCKMILIDEEQFMH